MTDWHFHDGQLDEAVGLVETHHYSHRCGGSIQFVATAHEQGGLFGDFGPAVAACVFGIPPTRWSEEVWELTRLVRHPNHTVPLTALIGWAANTIRRKKLAHLLVSFADKTQGHHGGIYQAASWNYAGARDRAMDGLVVNGTFVAGRSCNSSWGTRSPHLLRERFPAWEVEPHFDEGKHLYWRSLTREGDHRATRLELAKFPYPKPNPGVVGACAPPPNK